MAKIAQIARVGKEGTNSAFTTGDLRLALGKVEGVEQGKFVTYREQVQTQRKDLVSGELVPCEPWTNSIITGVYDTKDECIAASKSDELLQMEAEVYVAQKRKELTDVLAGVKKPSIGALKEAAVA